MSQGALAAARDIAGKVTSNLGVLGVFGVELFVKGDMAWFSEVRPRPGAAAMRAAHHGRVRAPWHAIPWL